MSNSTSSAKHTPGPWHWDSDPIKGDPLGRVRYRVVAVGRTITQCYYSSGDEQAEPDARLIATAPKLLSHLKIVAFHLRRGDFEKRSSLSDEALDNIEKTIAEAQGGAS